MFNYAINLTNKNREIQYAIATSMVKVLEIELLLIFGYVAYCMIQAQKIKNCTLITNCESVQPYIILIIKLL